MITLDRTEQQKVIDALSEAKELLDMLNFVGQVPEPGSPADNIDRAIAILRDKPLLE